MPALGRRALLALGLVVAACAAPQRPERPERPPPGRVERGNATWYGGSWHGKLTANGERFDQEAMTAAHKKLPFQTRVRVTNLKNGRQVTVRINDRGPYGAGRIIDLSKAAARQLQMISDGVVPVTVEVLSLPGR